MIIFDGSLILSEILGIEIDDVTQICQLIKGILCNAIIKNQILIGKVNGKELILDNRNVRTIRNGNYDARR